MVDAGGYDSNAFVSEYYDYLISEGDRPDIKFYVDAALESEGPVLEIGCGTGRVLLPIAREGIAITGIDLSPFMLERCRRRLEAETEIVRSKVKLVQADMRDFHFEGRFMLVTIPYRPFQHLPTVDDQLSCLRSVHHHLTDKGRFILEVFNPSIPWLAADNTGREMSPEPQVELPDGRKVIRRHKIVAKDYSNQINYMEMIYYVTHPDGRQERLVHAFPMRYLYRYEAEHLLYRCGLKVLDVYGDFKKSPYGTVYPGELIMVAKKA